MENNDAVNKLIKSFAIVGNAISQIGNEVAGETTYLVAKEALQSVEESVDKLQLGFESAQGIQRLADHLNKMLDKRINEQRTI